VISVPRYPVKVQVKIRVALLIFLWPLYLFHVLLLLLVLFHDLYDLAAILDLVASLFLVGYLLLEHHSQLEVRDYLFFLFLVFGSPRPI
jgi:hypothetical protein